MTRQYLSIFLTLFLWSIPMLGQDSIPWTPQRADGIAPLSILGDYAQDSGKLRISYRFMPTVWQTNILETNSIDRDQVLKTYQKSPARMDRLQHTLGIMYAPSDNFTLMLHTSYIHHSIVWAQNVPDNSPVHTTSETSGLADIRVGLLLPLLKLDRDLLQVRITLSLPTGDLNRSHDSQRLPYAMQLGSGTYDPSLGLIYMKQLNYISWGSQAQYTFALHDNSEGYRMGNVLQLSAWGAWKVIDVFSLFAHAKYKDQAQIQGKDSSIITTNSPLSDPTNSGRHSFDLGTGGHFYMPWGALKSFRIAVEFTFPIYHQVQGIQMFPNNTLFASLQYTL